jgi:hypothetical protein
MAEVVLLLVAVKTSCESLRSVMILDIYQTINAVELWITIIKHFVQQYTSYIQAI